jgi:hypothetical protein
MTINNLLKKYQNILYFMGRIFALCIFGPYLIYTGNKNENIILFISGILLIIWASIKLYLQIRHNNFYYENEDRNSLYNLYFIMRVIALFVVGPYLIFIGNKIKNNILVLLGGSIMIWDGAKIGIQLYYNDFSY